MIGLRYFSSKVEGGGIKYKLPTLIKELKWGFQRLWRGYDDSFCWSMDYSFISLYRVALKDFRDNLCSYPHEMTMEEWSDILDTMVSLLEVMEHESVINDYDMQEEAKDEFFKLFSKYFYNLWN